TPRWNHSRTPYEILKVSPKAHLKDIKDHYYQLCLVHHPDRTLAKSDQERAASRRMYALIQAAYAVLSDDQARRAFDL
ncbi:DnaJ domain-containing protein, partial [Blyttiomyces helicus]